MVGAGSLLHGAAVEVGRPALVAGGWGGDWTGDDDEVYGTVSFFNFDEIIYIPVQTLEKKILGVDHVKFISVKLKNPDLVEATSVEITELMRRRHNIDDPNKDDFSVTSIEEARKIIGNVFGAIQALLLSITLISLLVGGVGIMNVMYVAVTERTFEIGLLV